MRAVPFAGATAATVFGLRATKAASRRCELPPLRTPQRITFMAPTIGSRRMSVRPVSLTDPGSTLPPVDRRRGTRPSRAAKFRPVSNLSRSGAEAATTTAPAVTGPMPGIVRSRLRDGLRIRAVVPLAFHERLHAGRRREPHLVAVPLRDPAPVTPRRASLNRHHAGRPLRRRRRQPRPRKRPVERDRPIRADGADLKAALRQVDRRHADRRRHRRALRSVHGTVMAYEMPLRWGHPTQRFKSPRAISASTGAARTRWSPRTGTSWRYSRTMRFACT